MSTSIYARRFLAAVFAVTFLLALAASHASAQAVTPTPQQQLGSNVFFDTNLSEPAGQGCVSCHHPAFGFADPDQNLPVSEGVMPGRFGTRNSPSAAYAAFFPTFTLKGGILGGQFWDGRAADLTEQAKGPFLNPVEMNNTSQAQVIGKIALAAYASLFEQVCGPNAFDPANTEISYNCMAASIAAFEGTSELNKFTSKFDAYLAGLYALTPQEDQGRRLFSTSGKCAHCHIDNGKPVVFTDFKFHNIGLPTNREYPFSLLNPIPIDRGLGGFLNDPRQDGKFKNPHLRNIALTAPYMHNGVLKTLKQVVHFYNTRDVLAPCDPALGNLDPGFSITCWAAPEIPQTMDSSFLGDLRLTDAEEDAVVAFMMTFTDGFMP
ncbi:MAG: cytochrome c peroxidase [Nitrospirota bacterium]